jgi:cellulose biosynthesis protein BcsQ
MMGKMSMDEVMLTPGIDNLHIITCGTTPSNPAELMQSEKFKGFIDEIRDKYDVILMDSPPIISAADASIMAMKADGVLFVYRVGQVARGVLKRVKAQLEQVKANIIGVVLNGVKAEISPDFAELKQHKYYYYYGEEGKKKKREKEKGTNKFLRLFLILIAFFFLIFGLLWQNGIIDLDKYFFKEIKDSPALKESKIPSSPAKVIELKKIDTPKVGLLIKPSPPYTHYPYSLQIASYKSLHEVNSTISLLRKKGSDPYWNQVNLGEKGKWFRVFVGHFETLEAAEEFKESSSISGSRVLKTAYTSEIGYFPSIDGMNETVILLKKAGFSPYSIEDPQKGFRLLIGAYVTKEGADEMAHTLREAGIDSRVVLR